jgi:hypothetical protein
MEIAPINAVGPGSIYVPEIKPVSQAEGLMRIEKTNIVNKEDLITLETLKAEIAFYDTIN